jgi:hypothetical protein
MMGRKITDFGLKEARRGFWIDWVIGIKEKDCGGWIADFGIKDGEWRGLRNPKSKIPNPK